MDLDNNYFQIVQQGHRGPISGIAAFKGYIATAGYDNKIILWRDGEYVACNHHDHLVNQCSFSADGEYLVSSSSDGTARIWSIPDLLPISTLVGHHDDVEMAEFSPNCKEVVTASRDGQVRIFNLKGELLAQLTGHTADVISVVWSKSGSEIISTGDDGSIRRWHRDSKTLLDVLNLDGVETDTVVISPSGQIIAGNDLGQICISDSSGFLKIQAHKAGIKRLILSKDGQRLLSLSYDRKMCLFRFIQNEWCLEMQVEYPPILWARTASFVDEDRIVFGSFGDRYVQFQISSRSWKTDHIQNTPGINCVRETTLGLATIGDSGELRLKNESIEITKSFGELCNFVVEADGRLFVGGQTGRIFKYPSTHILVDLGEPVNCAICYSNKLFVGTYTGKIIVVDAENGQIICSISALENAVKSLAIHGSMAMAVGAARDLCWINLETFEKTGYLSKAHDKIANCCIATSGGDFATVSRDRKLRIFNSYHKQTKEILSPMNNSLKCVASSKTEVAVGTYGGQVGIYNLMLDKWVMLCRPTRSGISSIIFSEKSRKFIASSYDGNIYEIKEGVC